MGIYKNYGKEVVHCDISDDSNCERFTSIAQAKDNEAAHFLVVCANDYYDYMDEADATNSTIFRPQQIDRDAFLANLKSVRDLCEVLNLYKKLLVRGKTPEQLDMKMPLLHNSLAVEFDPVNCPDSTINVLHGAVGVITEAGEVADLLIRAIEDGDRDDVNVLEECGDLRWYIARMLRGINRTDRDCERTNINKLRGRHGATFDAERDANRDLVLERQKLEKDFGTPLFETNTFNMDVEETNGKETSDELSSLAAKVLSDPEASDREKKLAGSVLSQDETKGPRTADMSDVADAELAANVGTKALPPGGVRG